MTGRHRITRLRLPDPAVGPPRTPAGPGLSTYPLQGDPAMLPPYPCVTAAHGRCAHVTDQPTGLAQGLGVA